MTDLASPFTFSQSSLQDYIDCPRRFQLRYVEKLDWPAIEAEPVLENERRMQDGNFFHRLAQQYLLGLPVEKLSRLAASPDASTGLGTSLARWWDNFTQSFPNPADLGSLYAEATLSMPFGNHRLVAKYDLIALRDGKATIFDWKTYHKRPRNEWLSARMQTKVYRYLLASAGPSLNAGHEVPPENIQMTYWFADFPAEPAVFPYDEDQLRRDRSSLETTIREIEARSQFEMTAEEEKCRFCAYRSYCNRGTSAGDWHDAESEAESAEAFDVNFEQIGEIAF